MDLLVSPSSAVGVDPAPSPAGKGNQARPVPRLASEGGDPGGVVLNAWGAAG